MMHGTEEQQQNVMDRCIVADPKHGEVWCKISKHVINWCCKTSDILKLVTKELPIPI